MKQKSKLPKERSNVYRKVQFSILKVFQIAYEVSFGKYKVFAKKLFLNVTVDSFELPTPNAFELAMVNFPALIVEDSSSQVENDPVLEA